MVQGFPISGGSSPTQKVREGGMLGLTNLGEWPELYLSLG